MSEEQEPSEKYVKGFNSGYQMQKEEPELLDKIIKSDNGNNEYIQAMEAGKRQQQKETMIQEQKEIVARQQQNRRPKH